MPSSGRALFTGAENELVEEFHHVPALVALEPVHRHGARLCHRLVLYIRSPQTPRILAQQHRVLYQFLLNKVVFRRAL
ncbi:hypothetical protein ACOJBO_38045 [Rhizobium beringeri]